jgi:hypothetical protein
MKSAKETLMRIGGTDDECTRKQHSRWLLVEEPAGKKWTRSSQVPG